MHCVVRKRLSRGGKVRFMCQHRKNGIVLLGDASKFVFQYEGNAFCFAAIYR